MDVAMVALIVCGVALVGVIGFFLGLLAFPLIVFMRARGDHHWDDSNITNIYRVIAHIGAHPSDFAKMRYIEDGRNPFWYISKDEFDEVVKTRPKEK